MSNQTKKPTIPDVVFFLSIKFFCGKHQSYSCYTHKSLLSHTSRWILTDLQLLHIFVTLFFCVFIHKFSREVHDYG